MGLMPLVALSELNGRRVTRAGLEEGIASIVTFDDGKGEADGEKDDADGEKEQQIIAKSAKKLSFEISFILK